VKPAFLVMLVAVLSACTDKLSMDDCQKDTQCARSYTMVVSANETVSNACPRNSNETNPGCDSAMTTLNQAEADIFPRLKDGDAQVLSASLMATR